MNITLSPEQEKLIQEKVSSGKYNSAEDVINEALKLLNEHEYAYQNKLEALRTDIQKGIDSGPSVEMDFDELIKKAENRWDENNYK